MSSLSLSPTPFILRVPPGFCRGWTPAGEGSPAPVTSQSRQEVREAAQLLIKQRSEGTTALQGAVSKGTQRVPAKALWPNPAGHRDRRSAQTSAGLQPCDPGQRGLTSQEQPRPGGRRATGGGRSCLHLAGAEDTHVQPSTKHHIIAGATAVSAPRDTCCDHGSNLAAGPEQQGQRSAARPSVWEAPPKKVGGTSVSAIHVQVHSEAGKPLRSVASAEQHPQPRPPPAPQHGRTNGPSPRQPGAARQGPPRHKRSLLTWWSTLSVAMH